MGNSLQPSPFGRKGKKNVSPLIGLQFLGAVGGNVTPSGTVLEIRDRTGALIARFLVDTGSAIREETVEGSHMEALHFPADVDAIILSHTHTDHVGAYPQAAKRNPEAVIYCPEGNKDAIGIMVREAWKRRNERNPTQAIEEYKKNARKLVKKMLNLEHKVAHPGVNRGNRGDRKGETRSAQQAGQDYHDLIQELDEVEQKVWSILGLEKYSLMQLGELLGDEEFHRTYQAGSIPEKIFFSAIEKMCARKMIELGYQGIITYQDVTEGLKRIQEINFGTRQRIGSILKQSDGKKEPITVQMKNSGHTQIVPSAQVFFEIPNTKGGKIGVLFSGDRGNNQLEPPYAQSDDKGLENKADILVLESTYGDREHQNREKALQELDRIVCSAIEKGEDIIFPIISLDRPMVVMFELWRRLLKNNPKLVEKVDIYYFGNMIRDLLQVAQKNKHPMEKEIRKFWKELHVDHKKSQLAALTKPGKKCRIFFSGGGFVPKNGSPAGAMLEYLLVQDNIHIVSANYHGDIGSNGHNLFNRQPFYTTSENPEQRHLNKGHQTAVLGGFSGHEDAPGLVKYARTVVKEGGMIYLNHGSDKARNALYMRLVNDPIIKAKNIRVILPVANQEYTLLPNQKKINNPDTIRGYWEKRRQENVSQKNQTPFPVQRSIFFHRQKRHTRPIKSRR